MNINSNVNIIGTKLAMDRIEQIMDETGMVECLHRGKWLLLSNADILHGEFCGAAEYFNGPKGAA